MKLREVILCGLFIALITVGTFVRIPVGTDVYTLQFLFTLLAGLMLGARLGALAVGTYVLMGLGRRPGLCASADVRLSRGLHRAGLGDGRIGAPRRADVPPRACRVFGGHGGGLCPRHLVFLLCIELHHRRTDRLLGGGLVLRRAAGSAGLPALRRGGVRRDSPLQGGALDS